MFNPFRRSTAKQDMNMMDAYVVALIQAKNDVFDQICADHDIDRSSLSDLHAKKFEEHLYADKK